MNDELLAAELKRVFGRYRAGAVSVDDLAAARSRAWKSPGRPSVLGLSAGVVLVAACLASAALVLQPFAPSPQSASVFGSWRRVPTSPDPAMAGWASSHCTNTTLPLLIQDQRGTASLFVFRQGSTYLDCIVWTVDTPTEKGWFSSSSTGHVDDSAKPMELWSEMGMQVADQSSIETALGQAPGAASVVIVTAEGAEVQASLRDGIFAAWWPTSGLQNPSIREVRAYGPDGTLLGQVEVPPASGPPQAPWTPEPPPSGLPIPPAN
jgi:hypothetical protein